ncbi:MAG: DUF2922 family protein [Pyramidobacter sp.]|nr:DUF2922 family protein [Pyramidobacter sp.]
MSRTLSLKFATESGDPRSFSLADPKADLNAAGAEAAMGAIVTAGTAFADPITAGLKAEIVNREVEVLIDNE